eukprot:s615_g22.t1
MRNGEVSRPNSKQQQQQQHGQLDSLVPLVAVCRFCSFVQKPREFATTMHSWTSLTALSILLGIGPTYLRMDADVPDEGLEGVASEVLSASSEELLEVLPGVSGVEMDAVSEADPGADESLGPESVAPRALKLPWKDGGATVATLSFFFLTAVLDMLVLLKFLFRLGSWCRQKAGSLDQKLLQVGSSTTPAVVVQQLRLPCRPEIFEIHSEDEAEEVMTPCSKEPVEDTETPSVKVQLEQARAQIQALEKELVQQKEMNALLKEELRAKEAQNDANAVLQSELQVSRKELAECQEEANVMRVQLDALAEMRSGQVPCRDCLSVFADWLKASLNDMAVQIPMQLQVIHNPKQQQALQRRLDSSRRKPSLRKAPTSTSSGGFPGSTDSAGKDSRIYIACFE